MKKESEVLDLGTDNDADGANKMPFILLSPSSVSSLSPLPSSSSLSPPFLSPSLSIGVGNQISPILNLASDQLDKAEFKIQSDQKPTNHITSLFNQSRPFTLFGMDVHQSRLVFIYFFNFY